MTATSAGGSTCLTTKGLDISLAALRRQDPYINNIVDVASQVALYTFNNRTNEWVSLEWGSRSFVSLARQFLPYALGARFLFMLIADPALYRLSRFTAMLLPVSYFT